ncbi:MAG: hypothetical protein E6R04_07280 [Spirochaetes bacterium]|nr:MAG: hypothetical protein E6R04_07280 [Spirochaetota bacterium]
MDITSIAGWHDKAEPVDRAHGFHPMQFQSVGFYVSHDKEFLRIAETEGLDRWGGITLIPRGTIKRVRKLKAGKEFPL